MKVCPSCKTQYTDDSLSFCLQDGTRLIRPETDSSTIAFGETETMVGSRDSEVTQWRQSEEARTSQPAQPKKSSKVPLIAVILALLLVIFVGGAGVLAWLIFRPVGPIANNSSVTTPTPVNPRNTNSIVNNNNRAGTPTPTARTNLNVAFPTPTPTQGEDPATIRRDVTSRVNDWKDATESLDVGSLMRHYADTVDYYRRGSTSSAFVRVDKQRAFSRFSSIRITISNLNVSVDPAGDRATAIFDKEWVFEGTRTSTGKVRSQLQFKKIDDEWLITGEKDLSVYYTN